MHISTKTGVIIVSGIIALQAVTPVFAFELRGEEKAEAKGNGFEVHAEASEDAGSRPGLLRNFLTRGRAAIGSGTIKSISGTTLTVTDKSGKVVTVLTDSKTQFRRRFWGKSSISEMSVGDTVNIIGKWTDDTKTTIQAKLVRDLSIQKRFGVFFGTVTSVNSTGFVLQTIARGTLTVTISSTTKLINRKGQTILQSDIMVGHKVRVNGLWDSKLHTLTEVAHVKDFSIPASAATTTPTATPTVTPTPTP